VPRKIDFIDLDHEVEEDNIVAGENSEIVPACLEIPTRLDADDWGFEMRFTV
jgi:hypothetical protein